LDIELDIFSAAEKLAQSQGVSTGKALSELARQGLQSFQASTLNPQVWTMKDGLPALRSRGTIVTDEDIRRIRDAEGV
jgi:hypothetical protein